MASRGGVFGMDRELAAKKEAKYDPLLEEEARKFVCSKSGAQIPPGKNCLAQLKDGVALCQVINTLRPGSVKKINANKMAFMMMENIANYLKGCEAYGVKSSELFQTVDLYEEQNMNAVVINIVALARKSGYVINASSSSQGESAYVAAEKAYVAPSAAAPSYKPEHGMTSGTNVIPLLQAGAHKAGQSARQGGTSTGRRDINVYGKQGQEMTGDSTLGLMHVGVVAAANASKGATTVTGRQIDKNSTVDYGRHQPMGHNNTVPLLVSGANEAGKTASDGAHGPGIGALIAKYGK